MSIIHAGCRYIRRYFISLVVNFRTWLRKIDASSTLDQVKSTLAFMSIFVENRSCTCNLQYLLRLFVLKSIIISFFEIKAFSKACSSSEYCLIVM